HVGKAGEFRKEKGEVVWCVNDFIEVGGMGMVAASPGLGKTQLSLQLAIACTLGKPFLGWNIERQQNNTFLNIEMSFVALQRFLETILEHYTDEERVIIEERLSIIDIDNLPLSQEGARTYLYGLLEEARPDGLIIDSFGKLTNGKLDEETVKKLNNELGSLRRRFNCWVWLIHHNRKTTENNKQTSTLDDIFGSVYITAEQSAVLLLWRGATYSSNKIKVFNVKNRLSVEREDFFLQRDEHLHYTVTETPGEVVGQAFLKGGENDSNGDTPDKGRPHFKF